MRKITKLPCVVLAVSSLRSSDAKEFEGDLQDRGKQVTRHSQVVAIFFLASKKKRRYSSGSHAQYYCFSSSFFYVLNLFLVPASAA